MDPKDGTNTSIASAIDRSGSGILSDPSDAILSGPVDLGDESLEDTSIPKPISRQPAKGWLRMAGLGLLGLAILIGIPLVIRSINLTKQETNASANLASTGTSLRVQAIPLPSAVELGTSGAPQQINTLTVNGQVSVAGSLQLQAISAPANPAAGQLFYDQSTNQLGYYDGKGFVYLNGSSSTANNYTTVNNNITNQSPVTNITNITQGSDLSAINGTAGSIALFNSANTLSDSVITQNGTTVAVGGTIDDLNGTTINVGTGSNNSVSLGSANNSSTTTIQAGTGGITINTGATTGSSGGVTIQSGDSSTSAAGNVSIDTGSGLITGEVISNNTFEDGLDNITPWFGDTVTQSNAENHTPGGTDSLAVTTTSQFWGISDNANFPGLSAQVISGHHYYFTAWVRAGTVGRQINGFICWNATTCENVQLSTVTDSSTAWTEITGTAVAPGGAVTANWNFFSSNSDSGEVHYFDDFTVTDLSASSSVSELNLGATDAQFVTLGNANEIGATTIDGGSGITLNGSTGPVNVNGGAIEVSGTASSSFATDSGTLTLEAGGGTGGNGVTVTTQANSTSAFAVQGADNGATLLNIDTTDNTVSLGNGAGASFGKTSLGTSQSGSGNTIEATKFTTGVTAGVVNSLSVYLSVIQPSTSYQMAIYSDNAGLPGNYVGATTVGAMSATPTQGWYTLPLSPTVTLSPSTTYWLIFWANTTINDDDRLSLSATGGTFYTAADTWQSGSQADNGLPSSVPAGGNTYTGAASIYATYAANSPALTINQYGTLSENGAALFQDQTDSTIAFQIQSGEGAALLTADTADMQITIGGSLSVSGTITVGGHIISGGSTPAIAIGAATSCAGGSPAVSITGTDTAGTVAVTTGTGCTSSGTLATITFASAFGVVPTVELTPGNAISQTMGAYVDDATISTTSFNLGTNATPSPSQTYKWNYQVIQP